MLAAGWLRGDRRSQGWARWSAARSSALIPESPWPPPSAASAADGRALAARRRSQLDDARYILWRWVPAGSLCSALPWESIPRLATCPPNCLPPRTTTSATRSEIHRHAYLTSVITKQLFVQAVGRKPIQGHVILVQRLWMRFITCYQMHKFLHYSITHDCY